MARVQLTLLGGFQARLDSAPAPLTSRKAQALLAYLACPIGQAHPRDKLAALLWGGMGEAQARGSLRQAIRAIRKAFRGADPLVLAGETVALDARVVAVDAAELEAQAAAGTPAALERVAAIYAGDLLAGPDLQEGPFDEWLLAERERLRGRALYALDSVLAQQQAAGAHERAAHTAARLLAVDPLQESVHRVLMQVWAQLGRRGAALRQYQLCVDVLKRELDAEPEEATRALYQSLLRQRPARKRGATEPTAAAPASTPASRPAAGPPAIEHSAPEIPLIGREEEMARLRTLMAAVRRGAGQLVMVVGEAGVGKSRLAAELMAAWNDSDGRGLVGRCYETEQILPFGPWVDALRTGRIAERTDTLSTLPGVWRAELARLLPEIAVAEGAAGPAAELLHLFEAVAQLLQRLADPRPLALLLEDLHWADETSVRLLAFIARRLSAWPVLLVATVREEELSGSPLLRQLLDELARDNRLQHVHLGPLAQRDVASLAQHLARSGSAPTDLAVLERRIWQASEGNAFMAVEAAHAIRDGAMPEGAPALLLPDRVRDLIARRFDRLSDRGRRLVGVAAVIGRRFEFALLPHAADLGEDEAAEGVEELVRHRVLNGLHDGFEFTHDQVREVAHGLLLPARRTLLHRRIAESLETVHAHDRARHVLAIGTHYHAGEVWVRAVPYLEEAGAQAAMRLARRDAVVCYEQALTCLAMLPETPETRARGGALQFALGHALFSAGELPRAMEHYRRAEALARALGDDPLLAQALAGISYVLGSEGTYAGAVDTGEQALTLARTAGDASTQIWTSVGLVRAAFAQGQYRRAAATARATLEALADTPPDERFGRAGIRPSVAARAWLALCCARLGEFDEGIPWGEEALRIAEGVEGPQERVWALYCLGRLHAGRGAFASAIPLLEEALELCRSGNFPIYSPRVTSSLGSAYAQTGRMPEALPLIERGLAEAQTLKILYGHSIVVTYLGEARMLAGDLDGASALAAQALAHARQRGERGDEAWALHLTGEIAARREPPDVARALDAYRASLSIAGEFEMRPLQARCHLGLGELLHGAGRPDAARAELGAAVALFRTMGISHWRVRAEALLTR